MRLTLRGRLLVLGLAASAAFTAGLTAQHWNPYTRQLDHGACYEDTGCADGTPWDCRTMGNQICGAAR